MKITIVLVIILGVILGGLFWVFGPKIVNKDKSKEVVSLTYWGFEEESTIKPLVAEFEAKNPNIKVIYVRGSPINYRTRVQTQVREGVGPDVFQIHNSWLPLFLDDLYPAPSQIFTPGVLEKDFYPIVKNSFVKNNEVFAAVKDIDGLALYINEDILRPVGAKDPKNWQEFIETASKLTVKDGETGMIQTAGAALGSTSNVDYWSDLLGLLLLQQGVSFEKFNTGSGEEVLSFYTGFITDPRRKVWDVNLPSSTQMFTSGKLGFYFAPLKKAKDLRAANLNLNLKITPVPQLPGRQVAWASFFGEAVSRKTKYPNESWQFVSFLSSKGNARIDSAATNLQDPVLGINATQGPYYKSLYLSREISDGGINDEMVKVFEDGISSILAGQNAAGVVSSIDQQIKSILVKYNTFEE